MQSKILRHYATLDGAFAAAIRTQLQITEGLRQQRPFRSLGISPERDQPRVVLHRFPLIGART